MKNCRGLFRVASNLLLISFTGLKIFLYSYLSSLTCTVQSTLHIIALTEID